MSPPPTATAAAAAAAAALALLVGVVAFLLGTPWVMEPLNLCPPLPPLPPPCRSKDDDASSPELRLLLIFCWMLRDWICCVSELEDCRAGVGLLSLAVPKMEACCCANCCCWCCCCCCWSCMCTGEFG